MMRSARSTDNGPAAGIQAIKDSGLETTEENAERIGVAVGAGIGGIYTIENNYDAFLEKGPRKISPFFVPAAIINMVAGNLSIMHGYKGPNISIVSACSTGAHNIADLSLIHISEPTRRTPISYAVFCL